MSDDTVLTDAARAAIQELALDSYRRGYEAAIADAALACEQCVGILTTEDDAAVFAFAAGQVRAITPTPQEPEEPRCTCVPLAICGADPTPPDAACPLHGSAKPEKCPRCNGLRAVAHCNGEGCTLTKACTACAGTGEASK